MTQDMFALEANLPTSLLPSTLKYKNFLKVSHNFFWLYYITGMML